MISWLENHMIPCLSKKFLGIDCPGCGMQRSLVELLKGNFTDSFLLYPPLIPVMLMVGFLGVHLVFRFNNGGRYLQYLFIFNAAFIFLNYMARLVLSII